MTELRRQAAWQTVFFTLKDPESGACLSAAMPRGQFDALRLELANGERVHVYGRPELWEQKGELRLRAMSIERFGLGEHLAALERLKAKLAAEGLFAEARKRPLPRLPRRIGLVTGNDAAAKRDVLTTIQARFPPARVARRRDVRAGPTRRRGDGRGAGGGRRRARGRRRHPRPRRRQLRGPAPVQRRAARARGRRVPGAGRDRGRPRAGHAALRSGRRPARVDPDRRGPARRPRPRGAARRARAARATASPAGRDGSLERHQQRLAHQRTSGCAARRRCSSSAAAPRSPRRAGGCARSRRARPSSAATRSSAREDELVRSSAEVVPGRPDRGRGRRRLVRSARRMTYEEAEKELTQIVERLERGDASLDEALKLWERGEELYRFCVAPARRRRGEDRGAGEASRRGAPGRISSRAMAVPLDLLRKIDLFEEMSGQGARAARQVVPREPLRGRRDDRRRGHSAASASS